MKKILFFLLLLFPTNAFAINFKMSCSGNWSPTEFFDEKYVIQILILVSMKALIINLKVKIEGHIKKMKVLELLEKIEI